MVSYNDHGRISEYTGKTDEGLKNYFQSLRIAEEIGNFYGVGSASNNISILYSVQKDYKKALEYTFKSLENNQKINRFPVFQRDQHSLARRGNMMTLSRKQKILLGGGPYGVEQGEYDGVAYHGSLLIINLESP